MDGIRSAIFDHLNGVVPFDLDLASKAGRERVRLAIDALGVGFFESDLTSDFIVVTPNVYAMFGLTVPAELPGKRTLFWECYHPDDREPAKERFQADLLGERGRDTYQERLRIIRKNDRQIRWIEFTGRMFGPSGARTHAVGITRDVTEQVETEQRQQLLIREVNHRANNALAVVQSILHLTRADAVADYRADVQRRILSLSRSHSLLVQREWQPTDIGSVIENEMAAYSDHATIRVQTSLVLVPTAVQPVAMILHELATNAAKHGAFVNDGHVLIEAMPSDGDAIIVWTEKGGPPVPSAPLRRGTGMTVIGAQVRQLGGMIMQDWCPDGLCVEVRFPLERWVQGQAKP